MTNDVATNLWAAYTDLCVQATNGWRETTDVFSHLNLLDRYPNANDMFKALKDQDIPQLATNATLFFGNADSVSKQQFKDTVRNLSTSFLRSREALHQMLQIALTALILVDRDESLEKSGGQDRIKSALADLVTQIIQPGLLPDAWTKSSPNTQTQLTSLGLALMATTNSAPLDALGAALRGIDSSRTTIALLAMDAEVSKLANWQCKFMFGLTRGPTARFDQAAAPGVQELKKLLSVIPASGLERGRPEIGLETMIDDYLRLEHDSADPKNDATLAHAREQLLSALVNFSEKVLFVSNYGTLLDPSTDSDVKGYLMVLQAVGNSILNQADELHEQSQHKVHETEQASSMIAATTNAFGPNFTNLIDATDAKTALAQLTSALRLLYIKELSEGNTTISTNSTSVINTVITTNLAGGTNIVLTTNSTASVVNSSTSRANSLAAAIAEVTEMRANEIYLRPASAYLRNSYPATSLQNGTPVFWQNMLQDHALRQLPLADQFKKWANPNPLAAGEIDKAFWQNINRVRVAGAGNVNYVIVKDDIGNWYVKQYAADPSNIINSAKNLALFSAGPSFGANFPVTAGDGTVLSGAGSANGLTGNSILDKQFAQAFNGYTNDSAALYNDLTDAATNLVPARLTPAWNSSSPTNVPLLTTLATGLGGFTNVLSSAQTKLNNNKDASQTGAILAAGTDELLQEIKRYNFRLSQAIDVNTNFVGDATAKSQAKLATQREIRGLLEEYIGKRQNLISRYESQLNLIGSSASP